MRCSLRVSGLAAALFSALAALLPVASPAHAEDRTLPMRFDLRLQGPSGICGTSCKTWISASGAITADSGRDFAQFIKGLGVKDPGLEDATVVLDSDGGSVLGAIALGREIRKARLAATVGRIIDLDGANEAATAKAIRPDGAVAARRGTLTPRADCESMCAFVLLGGVRRTVPAEARVMVHQIWLGDRRDDPTAATYSAEDLVLVQRDIGRLAQFTAEMGGSGDLLDLALRIPPWEPLHTMTQEEIRRTKLATNEEPPQETVPLSSQAPAHPVVAAATVAASPPLLPLARTATDGIRATPISERRWTLVDRAGAGSLARRHPLTVEGDDIGSFDLIVSCSASADSLDLSYVERRHGRDGELLSSPLGAVRLRVGRSQTELRVASSERLAGPDNVVSRADATIPAALMRDFAAAGDRSMVIETEAGGTATVIRLGNTGAQQNLPRLLSGCARSLGLRASLAPAKVGGMASAD